MTPDEISLLQRSLARAMEHKSAMGDALEHHFREKRPASSSVFGKEHLVPRERMIKIFALAIKLVDKPEEQDAHAREMALGRLANGNAPEEAEIIAECSLLAMRDCLGEDYTPETHRAWEECLGQLIPRVGDWMRRLAAEG